MKMSLMWSWSGTNLGSPSRVVQLDSATPEPWSLPPSEIVDQPKDSLPFCRCLRQTRCSAPSAVRSIPARLAKLSVIAIFVQVPGPPAIAAPTGLIAVGDNAAAAARATAIPPRHANCDKVIGSLQRVEPFAVTLG